MMMPLQTRGPVVQLFRAALLLWLPILGASAAGAASFTVASPNGQLRFTLDTARTGLRYTVKAGGKTVIEPSALGLTVDTQEFGQDATLGRATLRSINETYPVLVVHSTAVNKCNEAVLPLTSGPANTPWVLEVRAFDDGVAYRYRVPGSSTRQVVGESSQWILPKGCTLWYQNSNNKAYESEYVKAAVDTLATGTNLAAPATVVLPGKLGYAMMTEANLVDYSDMALEVTAAGTFHSVFPNDSKGWTATGEIVSPWRVTLVARDLNTLVNTDVIRSLCPPPSPELAAARWIVPGRSSWHWMVTGSPLLEAQRQWVDWTKQLGFEYYLIDDGWVRWRAEGKDQWDCLRDVVDYARSQGVRIFAWVNSEEMRQDQQRLDYLEKARRTGVVGLKIDFPHPANTEWVRWYDDTLRDTARFRLMVDFHGAVKPTGRERTWPHELTREAIRGREQGKLPGSHDTALPFIRFVQGHADYTPTDFRTSRLKTSSWARELSQAIVYTSPFLCLCGSPENYLQNPAVDVLKALPAVWDETIVLPGSEIGEVAGFARRHGNEWFIGVVNGATARNFLLDLKFLGEGSYHIDQLADSTESNAAWQRTAGTVTRKSKLTPALRADGGFVARITPIPASK